MFSNIQIQTLCKFHEIVTHLEKNSCNKYIRNLMIRVLLWQPVLLVQYEVALQFFNILSTNSPPIDDDKLNVMYNKKTIKNKKIIFFMGMQIGVRNTKLEFLISRFRYLRSKTRVKYVSNKKLAKQLCMMIKEYNMQQCSKDTHA